jgi:hypothetical protein
MNTGEHNEIDMIDALGQKVRSGEPIYVSGPLCGRLAWFPGHGGTSAGDDRHAGL